MRINYLDIIPPIERVVKFYVCTGSRRILRSDSVIVIKSAIAGAGAVETSTMQLLYSLCRYSLLESIIL
jgi:hypothetical protein